MSTEAAILAIGAEPMTNAVRHAFPGSGSGTVSATFGKAAPAARLEAGNDGAGLPEGTLGRCGYNVSPSARKLRGWSPEEVMAQPVERSLAPESTQRAGQNIAKLLPDFIAQGSGTHSQVDEVDQPRRDGGIVHAEVTTTFVLNERRAVEIFGVSRDIAASRTTRVR
jgi:PAS domain S-box-containing protein